MVVAIAAPNSWRGNRPQLWQLCADQDSRSWSSSCAGGPVPGLRRQRLDQWRFRQVLQQSTLSRSGAGGAVARCSHRSILPTPAFHAERERRCERPGRYRREFRAQLSSLSKLRGPIGQYLLWRFRHADLQVDGNDSPRQSPPPFGRGRASAAASIVIVEDTRG